MTAAPPLADATAVPRTRPVPAHAVAFWSTCETPDPIETDRVLFVLPLETPRDGTADAIVDAFIDPPATFV
jgi:hypothetical protein